MTAYQIAVLKMALGYYAKGLSVIPLKPQNKEPLIKWEQYQNERATPQQIRGWVETYPDLNLGLVTGSVSGIAVVDIEAGGSVEGFEPTATVRTGGGGWHLYYSIPKGTIIPNRVRVHGRELTDVRGEGGYVVAPPSSTDNSYLWEEPLTKVSDLPPFPMHLLAKSEEPKSWESIPTAEVREGSRNDAMASFIGGFLATLKTEQFSTIGWPVAKGVNNTFLPPLEEKEVRAVFESIAAKELTGRKGESEIPPFKTFTLRELYEEKLEVRWLVKDLIPLDSITAITGDSNSYKTFLTQDLALRVVSGEPFLGHFPVETRGKVLIVDEENPRSMTQGRFARLGVEPNDDIVFLSYAGFRADVEKSVERLREVIEREKPVLVILDSLVDIHSANENDAGEVARVFDSLRKRILMPGTALVLLHHRRKTQAGQGGAVGQNIRGSSSIRAAIDCHLAVDRRGNEERIRITQDKLRVQRQLDSFWVSLAPTKELNLAFTYDGEDKERDEAIQDLQVQILEHLKNLEEEWHEAKALADALGVPRGILNEALKTLQDSGAIVRKNGRNNRTLWALAAEEPEAPAAIAADNSVS